MSRRPRAQQRDFRVMSPNNSLLGPFPACVAFSSSFHTNRRGLAYVTIFSRDLICGVLYESCDDAFSPSSGTLSEVLFCRFSFDGKSVLLDVKWEGMKRRRDPPAGLVPSFLFRLTLALLIE